MNGDIISIKGTRNGLVALINTEYDFTEIKNMLRVKIVNSRGFFKGARITFHYPSDKFLTEEMTVELENICSEYGLLPDRQITWPTASEPRNITAQANNEVAVSLADDVNPVMKEASPSLPESGITQADREPSLLVNRSLRSGQKISYDGNVIIMGDVNPGSEITASGNIVVWGSLRGVVHAGAGGKQDCSIMAFRLKPVQLRIASIISRSPENQQLTSYPEVASLANGKMVIEPYLTYGLRKN
ncbi:septum site-determining protein MinC [Phosphitispora fastidiosa]|uniref:septum site-determining protein MinC n=1 Tax=Phosphitispora fastidiosa TaxID=2837202 RepID=UPI001E50EF0A|nr:septum site-determining protein MinC [Phosphitispora fastidiosa]MBU7005140.1 septum site-determining protein MinC [Phosphitispora fastidiosa]